MPKRLSGKYSYSDKAGATQKEHDGMELAFGLQHVGDQLVG
jgi:hypothetical protein